ncbi:YkvA family protein [Haladaptatus sp. YSMS36]|uniref:YkvA family protein n=1 Tax=Haladaptatus sp. YSMS36 TaxID=3033384 RepID=UPI0023E8CF67|nr:hypothetical protein [Haladaptatus sp. YSMS36]
MESYIIWLRTIAEKYRIFRILKVRPFLRGVHQLYYIVRDPETPWYLTIIGLFGVGWVLFLGDFDFIPYLGWIDDYTVFTVSNSIVRAGSSHDVISRAESKTLRGAVSKKVARGKKASMGFLESLIPLIKTLIFIEIATVIVGFCIIATYIATLVFF